MSIKKRSLFSRTSGMAVWFWLILSLCTAMGTSAFADTLDNLVTAEYVIDGIPGLGGGQLLNLDNATQFNSAYIIENISGADLSVGVHTLSLRFQSESGLWSPAIQQSFYWPGYKGPLGDNSAVNPLVKGEVFFDDNIMEPGTGVELELAADGYLDTGFERLQRIAGIRGISAGEHSVSIKLLDSSGIWSSPINQSFYIYKNPLINNENDNDEIQPDDTYFGDNNNQGWFFPSRINNINKVIAYFDDNSLNAVELDLPAEDELQLGSALNLIKSIANITNVAPGAHSFHLSFQDNIGEWSQPISQSVIINPTHSVSIGETSNRLVAARYSVDENSAVNLTAQDGAFDDVIETIEQTIPVTNAYYNISVNFLDLSGQWTDPLNNVTERIENDRDGNGISDQWELTWFGQVGINPALDTDNDGVSNLNEYLAGTNPLIPNDQTGLTISGYVKNKAGQGIAHVLVCIQSQESCTVRTDEFGHYVLGLGEGLAATEHTVFVRSTSASGVMAFSSPQTILLDTSPVNHVNFTTQETELTWSFIANDIYRHNEQIDLQWQSNIDNNVNIIVELKRDSISNTETTPDNKNWYRFNQFTQNNGELLITIPQDLELANDWRLTLSIAETTNPVLVSELFEIATEQFDVPVVEIDTLGIENPTVTELFGAELINLDESKTIVKSHWSAVRLLAGEESGQRITLSENSSLLTDELTAGEWRLYLQAQDESGQWSAAASKDLYVTAVEDLADLALNQTSVQIFNSAGTATYTADVGETVTVEIKVSNAGTIDLPDEARVIVKNGFGIDATTLGTVSIKELAAGAETTVTLPVTVSNEVGYQNLTVNVQFLGNIDPNATQPAVAESNRFNNEVSLFLIVGNPPAGSFGIDVNMPTVFTVYPGQSTLINGLANYSFGSRMPVIGTQVYIDFEQSQYTGRTTSPAGRFAVGVKAPLDLGDYNVNVTVNGGYMEPARKNVILRVIPWPTIEVWRCDVCTYSPPPKPTPIKDLVIKRLILSGEGYYKTDNNINALVQNTDANVVATIHNRGNLNVDSSFKVLFFYIDETDAIKMLGDAIIVNSGLQVGQHIKVSASQAVSFNQLGYRQVFAEITELADESYTENNQKTFGFDVRENLPDLRGNYANSLRFSKTKPVIGEQVRIFADVINRGPADFNDSFTIKFYNGTPSQGELIDSATFSGSIEKWQTTTLQVNWTATTTGYHNFTAIIDSENDITEDVESNNGIAGSLTVIPDIADLYVALALSDYSVTPGTTIKLSGGISNSGTQPSEATNVSFYFGSPESGGELIAELPVDSLASKTGQSVFLDWNTLIPHGNHSICAVIASNGRKACKTLTITDLPSPDLQVFSEDITYVPGPNPELNDDVMVSAIVRNVSAFRHAQNVTVQFFADSPSGFFQIGDLVTIDNIALKASAQATASTTFNVNQPYYALQVRVVPSANDGDANLADNTATTAFAVNGYVYKDIKLPADFPSIVSLNDIEDGDAIDDTYNFSVTLSKPLPDGYGVFLNFDDQQGQWFDQTDDGGHFVMSERNDSVYSLTYKLVKPGLRSFRAGVFDLQGVADPSDDILVLGYTAYKTCTLESCKASLTDYITASKIGNPALSGSGSQLFKNVDVATGNYHLSVNDIAVNSIGPSFAMTRAYNSMSDAATPWSFAYEMQARLTGEFSRRMTIGPREDGRMQHYFKDMDQNWYALNPGNFDQLIEEESDIEGEIGKLTLYTKGNRLYRFSAPGTVNAGNLQAIEDRLSNALVFEYQNNKLIGATDASNNRFTITRDQQGRIQRVTDFANRYVEYTYNDNNMITAIRNINGRTHYYTYGTTLSDHHLLMSMTDPRNITQVTIAHDINNRVIDLTQGTENVNQIKTQFLYTQSSGEAYTAVIQPEIASINHNVVYLIDNDGVRIKERIDANDYDEFFVSRSDGTMSTKYSAAKNSYIEIKSRTRVAEQSLVAMSIDLKGNATEASYSDDGRGNVVVVKDALAREQHKTYAEELLLAGQSNLTPVASVTLPSESDIVIRSQYKDYTLAGTPQKIINPRGYISNYVFDAKNNVLKSIENNRGYLTQLEQYDANGNVKVIIDAQNNLTQKTYDNLSRLTQEVSPLGLTSSYTYYDSGKIKTKTLQANGGINYTTQYFYDASDNRIKEITPKGHVILYVYDDLNRLVEKNYTVAGELYSHKTEYDALNRIVKTINPRGRGVETAFTARNKVQSKTNALGEVTVTYTYDKNGNVETVTDAESRTLTTVYDELNRKTHVVDDLHNQQQWIYNKAGQVKTYIDSRDEQTYYEYDVMGNTTKVTDANGGITRSTYDENNNLTKVIGPNGQITEYVYDSLDRRTKTIIVNGSEQQEWQYSYDANVNVLTETKPTNEQIVKVYDALNRVTQLTEYNAANNITRQISYTYDANNNVETQSDGISNISYSYDEINRVTSVTDQFGQTIAYGYDKANNRTELTYPCNKTINYQFDTADRLTGLTDWLNNTTTYTLNKAGQVTQTLNGNGTVVNQIFDNAGRLTLLENLASDSTIINRHQLTLDSNGNIKTSTGRLPLQPTLPLNFSATYDTSNRIITAGERTFEHDLSGRIIEQDNANNKTIYNFDINDQLTTITGGSKTLSRYSYDLNNNRISQIQHQAQGVGSAETRYVIDQLASLPNVVAETNAQGLVDNYYIYGYGLVSKIDAEGNSHYYHYNPTGHTLALTDSSGNVTDAYAYTPYGKTGKTGSTHNPFLFVGKHGVMDDGNGLHFMRARYYKEDIKRFISLDALHGEMLSPQSLNRYAYVLGNPIMGIDPSGYETAIEKYDASIERLSNRYSNELASCEGFWSCYNAYKDTVTHSVMVPVTDMFVRPSVSLTSNIMETDAGFKAIFSEDGFTVVMNLVPFSKIMRPLKGFVGKATIRLKKALNSATTRKALGLTKNQVKVLRSNLFRLQATLNKDIVNIDEVASAISLISNTNLLTDKVIEFIVSL